jgi:uncharacterized protein (TIGR02757 family)
VQQRPRGSQDGPLLAAGRCFWVHCGVSMDSGPPGPFAPSRFSAVEHRLPAGPLSQDRRASQLPSAIGDDDRDRLLEGLETLYRMRNAAHYVPPDPLCFVRRHRDPADIEVAALLAATMAYGRVAQIHRSLERVFAVMEGAPARYACDRSEGGKSRDFSGFRHRFTTGAHIASLLEGAGRAIGRHGSLGACFRRHDSGEATLLPALAGFVEEVAALAPVSPGFLLARPALGSACKRWHLLLRWLVRRDNVDLGVWHDRGPWRLLVPLDTHMHRIGRHLGMTARPGADLKAALDITHGFRLICPSDPVRYDFSLTRSAIQEPALLDRLVLSVPANRDIRDAGERLDRGRRVGLDPTYQ